MNLNFSPGDSSYDLLRKILTVLGGLFQPGDSFNNVLRKILEQLNSVSVSAGRLTSSAEDPDAAAGSDGDVHINVATKEIWRNTAGNWTVIGSLS